VSADVKKESIREAFRSYAETLMQSDLGALNDKQRTLALTRFYVEELHNPLRPFISEEDFSRGYVDASGDLGIDFIHKDDHSVLIIQTKYASKAAPITPEDMTHFLSVIQRLGSKKLRATGSLRDALADIDLEQDQFTCKFITLGRIEGQSKIIAETPPVLPPIPTDLADRVTFEFLDERGLTDELRQAKSLQGIPQTSCTLYTYRLGSFISKPIDISVGDYRSCVVVLKAGQLVQLYNQYREGLFTLNIRNYLGSTATNKAIVLSAKAQPEEFFHLNNGVACVATSLDIDQENGKLSAEGFQIINGAQTVKSLRNAAADGWKAGEPLVLARITEISEGYGKSGRFRDQIVRANNTQNVIKVSDFRSNDPVQIDLKKKFSHYKRFGESVAYVHKRTDAAPRNTEVIRLEEFAKVIFSFMKDPVSFSGSTSFLFDASESGGYPIVFGDGKGVWDVMPDEEFRLRSGIWWMAREFEQRLKDDRAAATDPIKRAAQERKWWLIFAARIVLERDLPTAYRDELAHHYKGAWRLGEGAVGDWFLQLYKRAHVAVVFGYEQAAKQPGFVHRNWTRNPKSMADIKSAIETLSEIMPALTASVGAKKT
jgi:hypothetical protein